MAVLAAAQGILAAGLCGAIGQGRLWVALNGLLPMAAVLALAADLPGWVYGAAFAILVLTYWNAFRERVPLYLSNRETCRAVAGLLPDTAGPSFLDLGSGFGGPALAVADIRPDARVIGIESAPIPFAVGRLRLAARSRPHARLVLGDIWGHDLSPYDVVYAFLSPAPMARLFRKADAEMRPGTLLVSNSFEVPGQPPDEIRTLADRRRTRLMLWRMAPSRSAR